MAGNMSCWRRGGHHFMETKVGDQIIAYALPK